jgi:hypothetical protein
MAGGGGGIKKLIINTVLDKPVQVYIGGGVALWAIRQYQIRSTYGQHFGKIDYLRRKERNEL